MKATFVKSGTNYLPAIKCTYSGNVKVLHGDRLASASEDQGLADFLGRVAKRWAMESHGQDILDGMEERGDSPRDVADKFWADTYFKLPSAAQARFVKMANNHGGEGILTSRDSPSDVLDLPTTVDYLEGTERGFVALMKEGNDRLATAAMARKYAQIEINRINSINGR